MRSGRCWVISAAATVMAFGILACGGVATRGATDSGTNRAAARTEATRLLSLVSLPAGVTSVANDPAGDGGALARPGYDEATPNLVDAWG